MSSNPRIKCLRPRLVPPAPTVGWKADTVRGNRHQRGYGWGWEQLRVRILHRDSGLCQPCLKAKRVTIAQQVDHITPKAHGGTDDEANLQSICDPCHRDKTARERNGGGG